MNNDCYFKMTIGQIKTILRRSEEVVGQPNPTKEQLDWAKKQISPLLIESLNGYIQFFDRGVLLGVVGNTSKKHAKVSKEQAAKMRRLLDRCNAILNL